MPQTTIAAPANGPVRRTRKRRNASKLRHGVMKRGNTWSYVIRVKNPETGVSRPKWVGGFATEEAAKEARDQARVQARRGEYIDRTRSLSRRTWMTGSRITPWRSSHAPCSTTEPASGSM